MPESTRTQQNRHAAVTSALEEDILLLTRFHGVEHLGGIFEYELELTSEKPDEVDIDQVLGGPMTVRLELADGEYRYFNGIVSRFVMVTGDAEFPTYHATVVPWLWALTRSADCRIFHDTARQEWDVPKIVLQVFRDFGASAFRDALSGTYQKLEYTVQYAETAFNFVNRLLEREGIYYFFEHAEDAHTLVLADAPTAHEPLPNYADPLIYRGRDRAHPGEEHLFRWEVRKQVQPGAVALGGFDFKQPANDLKVRSTVQRPHPQSDFEVYDFPGSYIERDVGEQYARVRLEEFQTQHEVIHAEANVRGLACGYTFKVTGLPDAEEKEFLVTSARYTINNDAYASGGNGHAGDPFTCQFTAIPATQTYRPPRATPRPLIRGPQTAVVVGPSGEEIHTDPYGRVRVQFPWDRRGQYNEKSSCWIRVAQAWAGKKWGIIFTPRVGNEVIVEHLEGDPDRPVITGRVYNGDSMPPYDLPAQMTMSTLKTYSSKGGDGFNEIRFEDKKGEEQLFIHAQKRMDQRVRGSLYETNYGNREVRVGWEKDGDSGGDLNVYVHQNLSQHVKKHQYELVDQDYNYTVSGEVALNYEKNWTMSVGQKCTIASTDFVAECDAAVSYKSATFALTSSGAIDIKGGTVNIEGSTGGVNIKVGGNFVVVNTSGVSINGTTVMINSGGSASPAADAKSAEVGDLTDPHEAAIADDGKPGKNTKYSGGGGGTTRQWKKRSPKKHAAPPWVPPPSVPTGPVPVPVCAPPPVSTKPCGIGELSVNCGHSAARTPGPSRVLQVVTTEGQQAVKYQEKWDNGRSASIKVAKGGSETIVATVRPVDPAADGRKQTSLSRKSTSPANWVDGASARHTLACHPNDDLWPINASPELYYIFGRGCDGTAQTYTIQAFPSQQYEVNFSAEAFKDWIEPANKWLKKLTERFNANGAANLKIQLEPAKGSLTGKWGWKEDSDWRAYFNVEILIGLKPIIGLSVEFKVSAAVVGLSALGVPPPIGKVLADNLADLFVFVKATATVFAEGGPAARFYGTGEEKFTGRGYVGADGKLDFGLGVRVGSDYLMAAELRGQGSTKLTAQGEFTLKREGLYVGPKVKWLPLTVTVKVVYKAFSKTVKEEEASWDVFPEMQLYPDPDQPYSPRKLFPR